MKIPQRPETVSAGCRQRAELDRLRAANERLRQSNQELRADIRELRELISAMDPAGHQQYAWCLYGTVA